LSQELLQTAIRSCFDASSFAVNPSLYPKLPYDSLKAFRPIGIIALFPNVVLVNAAFPPQQITDLITSAKKAKDSVAFASSGNGSAQHLAGALFESATGVEMLHVPYKGGGPALVDVISGQVPVFFGNLASTLAHIQSGKLRVTCCYLGKTITASSQYTNPIRSRYKGRGDSRMERGLRASRNLRGSYEQAGCCIPTCT